MPHNRALRGASAPARKIISRDGLVSLASDEAKSQSLTIFLVDLCSLCLLIQSSARTFQVNGHTPVSSGGPFDELGGRDLDTELPAGGPDRDEPLLPQHKACVGEKAVVLLLGGGA